ncbi:hypothetical protein EC912_103210 [Luteibacter rhizovicinus]|uniref:Tetratricopeptide repeat protein n=2 Tax=Luteibacter rhizovicinus TaxID=242606 RepID=A0A4R3YPB0_9GAMM|nr:hypothetical protein EC912_103210 [Luteibacter rhizovicinus]
MADTDTLFVRFERAAQIEGNDIPCIRVATDGPLPVLFRVDTSTRLPPLPHAESLLVEAAKKTSDERLTACVLLIRLWLLQAEDTSATEATHLHERAELLIAKAAEEATIDERPVWRALSMTLALARSSSETRAARLLALRAIASDCAADIEETHAPVLDVWLDVLLSWATQQPGTAAARYAQATQVCERLATIQGYEDYAQRRHANIWRARAEAEGEANRLGHLEAAQSLLDDLYDRAPSPILANAVAATAYARANLLPPSDAAAVYSHALMHAIAAEADAHCRADALQCRLAIQLAYEELPECGAQGDVALRLAHRLEAIPARGIDTLCRMAEVYLRHDDFATACRTCERAWKTGSAPAPLLRIWRRARDRWAGSLPAISDEPALSETTRRFRIASATASMHR